MRTHWIKILLLVMITISGCSKPETVPTSNSSIMTPTTSTLFIPTSKPTATLAPKPTPSSIPTLSRPTATIPVTSPLAGFLNYKPITITTSLPVDAHPAGTLILWGGNGKNSYRLDFTPYKEQDFLPYASCLSTSPDGKWLTYCQDFPDRSAERWLTVESANGQEMKKVRIEKDWDVFTILSWLDNQRLVFNLRKDTGNYASIRPVIVLDPFLGKQQELDTDYPDLRPSGSGPAGMNFDFVRSTVVYHPSLNLVVYPQTIPPDGFFVVLWDRQSKKALAKLRDYGGFGHYPIWYPDGEQFVIAAIPQSGVNRNNIRESKEELFLVSREGQIQQLTHFAGSFDRVKTWEGNLSPDGKRLAFWLDTKPDLCGAGPDLAVLEMETRKVTSFCISSVYGETLPPVWSPDGKYIVVESFERGDLRAILVDIEQAWAAQIAEDAVPVGWLVREP
jgi:hypothetical protein